MAAASSSSSSSSFIDHPKKYDVFVSFRGEDVRYGFLSHLLDAFKRENIEFFDDTNFERGERISPAMITAIKQSCISLVIFSKNYPDSPWCLEELAQILDCYNTMQQKVYPVFFGVDPSDVQDLKGDFGSAFDKCRELNTISTEEFHNWRSALQDISCLAGFVSAPNKRESQLVGEIVDKVSVNSSSPSDSERDVCFGIDFHVRQVEKLLSIEKSDRVLVAGLWGMGGIGKTTTADKVFNKIKKGFDAYKFVSNVRETLETSQPKDLKKKIFCELLHEDEENLCRRKLNRKKFLIVFDDVDDSSHLGILLKDRSLYCPGSRIIVTSRDSQVLKNDCGELIHEVTGLDRKESLKLFSRHAFKQTHPKEEYVALSERAIGYARGLPLALIVLGSHLYDRTIDQWEDELKRLKSIPISGIHNVLRRSYDGLEKHEQNIFLDIACFFKGRGIVWVKRMLENFGWHAESGITRLLDKSLVTTHDNRSLKMHDLIEEMGKEIVRQESSHRPREQSRLWKSKDIIRLLSSNQGTGKIEGISLDVTEVDGKVDICSKAFEHMCDLRYLSINVWYTPFTKETNINLPKGLDYLPNELRYLCWVPYPLSSLPSTFCPYSLVELHMPHSQLEELGDLGQSLQTLKKVDLSCSRKLKKIPDFSKARNIEHFNIEKCSSLEVASWPDKAQNVCTNLDLTSFFNLCRVLAIPCNTIELKLDGCPIEQIPPSIWYLKSLRRLSLKGCKLLESLNCDLKSHMHRDVGSNWGTDKLPQNIGFAEKLEHLCLNGCSKLKILPDAICHLNSLRYLGVSGTPIEELPENIGSLGSLCELDLSGCENLRVLPESMCNLKRLQKLDVSGCVNLVDPYASKSGIQGLPATIDQLTHLWHLNCSGCKGLRFPAFKGLRGLSKIDLSYCHMLEFPDSLCNLTTLGEINLTGNDFKMIPPSISQLSSLRRLNLGDCRSLEHLPLLPSKSLSEVNLSGCTKLVVLPESLCNIKWLWKLDVSNTAMKELPENIGYPEYLKELRLSGCTDLVLLPESIRNLKWLSDLDVSSCVNLSLLENSGEFSDFLCTFAYCSEINLGGNNFKSIPSSIIRLFQLERLHLRDCRNLEHLPPLPSSLSYLDATNCTSLRRIHHEKLPSGHLILKNCINLENGVSSKIIDGVLDNHQSIILCIPASEVPEKMMIKNDNGSCLTVNVAGEMTKFSLCVVIDSDLRPASTRHLKTIKYSITSTEVSIKVFREDLLRDSHYEDNYPGQCQVLEQSQSKNLFLWSAFVWHEDRSNFWHEDRSNFWHEFLRHEDRSNLSIQFYAVYVDDKGKTEYNTTSIIKCGLHH